MNSRERILAAMQRKPVDRIPFVPNLNGYNIRSMPSRYHTMQRWEILKELGIDLLVRFRVGALVRPPFMLVPPPAGPATLAGSNARIWAVSMPVTDKIKIEKKNEGENCYIIVNTAVGSLRWGWRFTKECADMPFPIEYPIKDLKDVDTFRYILDHTVVEPAYDEIIQTLDAVGDEGTCEAQGGPTPIQELIEVLIGMQNFYFFFSDHTKKMEDLMAHMQQIRNKEYQILAESPSPIIITGENTSTTLSSPDFMDKYEFRQLDEFSDILHKKDKIHMVHMCGKLHKIIHLLEKARYDGSHDVAPPPTGDFDFKTDRDILLASGKCVSGGIDATVFATSSPAELEAYVKNLLKMVQPGLGFLLGSGDTVPYGTSAEYLKLIVKILENNGMN